MDDNYKTGTYKNNRFNIDMKTTFYNGKEDLR